MDTKVYQVQYHVFAKLLHMPHPRRNPRRSFEYPLTLLPTHTLHLHRPLNTWRTVSFQQKTIIINYMMNSRIPQWQKCVSVPTCLLVVSLKWIFNCHRTEKIDKILRPFRNLQCFIFLKNFSVSFWKEAIIFTVENKWVRATISLVMPRQKKKI